MAHRGETQKQTSRSNDTYCVNKPTETSCVCFSVLSRSKLQMVATSAARRRDKNDLCLTCVGVVDVAKRCRFVATQLVATRCSFVSLRCSFVSFRCSFVSFVKRCSPRRMQFEARCRNETATVTARRKQVEILRRVKFHKIRGQIHRILIVECASTRPPEGLSLTS